MKYIFTFIIILLVLPNAAKPFTTVPGVMPFSTAPVKKVTKKLSYKQSKMLLESSLGRKLKLKEKAALRLQSVLPDVRIEDERKANNNAVLGFVFAIGGLILLMPLLIPGYILSNNALRMDREYPGILTDTNRSLAKAGKIISLVGIILVLALIILIVVLIASGGFAAL